jgi:hypothetical protein
MQAEPNAQPHKLTPLANCRCLQILPTRTASQKTFFGFASLHHQCSMDELAVKLEEWSVIEESVDFVEVLNKEQEDCLSEEAFILSLHKEQNADSSDEEIKVRMLHAELFQTWM